MLALTLVVVLQSAGTSAPPQDHTAPQPSAIGFELPPGARILFAIDGQGIDHFGRNIAALDDVNGDGARDILLGSWDGGWTQSLDRSFVDVRSGQNGKRLFHIYPPPTFVGDLPPIDFGRNVGALADLDGDGVGEFFTGGEPELGRAYLDVYSSKTGARLHAFTAGENALEGLDSPTDLRAIGDLDGDDAEDYALVCGDKTCLLSGASWKRIGVLDAVVLGRSADIDGDGTHDFFCRDLFGPGGSGVLSSQVSEGRATNRRLARTPFPAVGPQVDFSRISIGDANGDGYRDAVFAFHEQTSASQPAFELRFRVFLVSGADASVLRDWWEELDDTGELRDVSFIGDFDRDGCDDIAIAHHANGANVSIVSGRTGERLARVGKYGPSFGACVTRLGDLDGDGRGELAIGEPEYGRCAGRVWVISLPKF